MKPLKVTEGKIQNLTYGNRFVKRYTHTHTHTQATDRHVIHHDVTNDSL